MEYIVIELLTLMKKLKLKFLGKKGAINSLSFNSELVNLVYKVTLYVWKHYMRIVSVIYTFPLVVRDEYSSELYVEKSET